MYFTGLFHMCRLGSTDDQNYFSFLITSVSAAEVDVPPHDLRILASSSFLAELFS